VAMHEIGHQLGLTQQLDSGELAIGNDNLGGTNITTDGNHIHLRADTSLLRSLETLGSGQRVLPSAADALAATNVSLWSLDLDRKELIDTEWHEGDSWIGEKPPKPEDVVFARRRGQANISQDVSVRELNVGNEANVIVSDNVLNVARATTVGLEGPARITIGDEAGPGTLMTGSLIVNPEGVILLQNKSRIVANEVQIGAAGRIHGGQVAVRTGVKNDGLLASGNTNPLFPEPEPLSVIANEIDLDGLTEAGSLNATRGDVTIDAPLTDAFHGQITIGGDNTLEFTNPWEMAGTLEIGQSFLGPAGPAALTGAQVTINGSVGVSGDENAISAPVLLQDGAKVLIPRSGDKLTLGAVDGSVVYSGGRYLGFGTLTHEGDTTVAEGAVVEFNLGEFQWHGSLACWLVLR